MRRKSIRAFSMMLLMMTAGCLQAVDGVIEDIDRTIDALEGDSDPQQRGRRRRRRRRLGGAGRRAHDDEDGWRLYLRRTRIGSCR